MNGQRALRPVQIRIPLKAGTQFEALADPDADEGQGLIVVNIDRVWDFSVQLSIEDYGTLGKFIEAMQKAQEAELMRIKKGNRKVREPTTPDPSLPEKSPVARRRRRKKK